jgi:HEAT repeat protein
VVPAIVSVIEMGRAKPLVIAEILKELGHLGDVAPNRAVRWILSRYLNSSSQFVRDGAGLGLARLADPATLPYLRRAVQRDADPQVKADLQLVIDEISEMVENGVPLAHGD